MSAPVTQAFFDDLIGTTRVAFETRGAGPHLRAATAALFLDELARLRWSPSQTEEALTAQVRALSDRYATIANLEDTLARLDSLLEDGLDAARGLEGLARAFSQGDLSRIPQFAMAALQRAAQTSSANGLAPVHHRRAPILGSFTPPRDSQYHAAPAMSQSGSSTSVGQETPPPPWFSRSGPFRF
ncbi:hypothetical protein BDV95DRAFT_584605 [Massariosphaeria phaeospora]|uniref:Uncharacterized protein n=1 Tax=Massariosphaeria phaeospora TaxID=100035 RepID=A0A7C8I134_9PLEO|nr:hypothetical protein BDV95DRAFT_584605 [Massariosphaeria phaeospora]